MSGKYVLDANGEPKLEEDVITWGRWLESANRHIDRTELGSGVHVSTVFLGLDHSFGDGSPILWETMIFGLPETSEYAQYQDRYSSKQAAVEGHKAAAVLAKAEMAKLSLV
jgi:hypothetical protein